MAAWTAGDIRSLRMSGVTDDELSTIRQLLSVWHDRLADNAKRSLYYDTEQAFKDLGIALPPQLKRAKMVLGWSTLAVRKPALRSQFAGLRMPGQPDPFDLDEILARNAFALEFGQAVVSAYTHGVSLVTVAKGGPGEVPVQIQAHSAETSALLWDRRNRRVGAALTISELANERPAAFVVYLPHIVLWCAKVPGAGWSAIRIPNPAGRALAVAVRNDPQLRRPFGRSRLTNAVMQLNDMAVRGFVRMEGNAEFYSSPQLALMGVDPAAFGDGLGESQKFKLAMERLIALTKDSDGDSPTLTQLQQASMQPHSDMLRTIGASFSAETGIPVSSLGIVHDQPASAEAIRAAEHDLLIDATYHNTHVHSQSVRDIATLAVMVRDDLSEPPAEAWRLSARFADPEFRSMSAHADAVQKIASDMETIAKWDVLLETAFDEAQVDRIKEQAASMAAERPAVTVTAPPQETPAEGTDREATQTDD